MWRAQMMRWGYSAPMCGCGPVGPSLIARPPLTASAGTATYRLCRSRPVRPRQRSPRQRECRLPTEPRACGWSRGPFSVIAQQCQPSFRSCVVKRQGTAACTSHHRRARAASIRQGRADGSGATQIIGCRSRTGAVQPAARLRPDPAIRGRCCLPSHAAGRRTQWLVFPRKNGTGWRLTVDATSARSRKHGFWVADIVN